MGQSEQKYFLEEQNTDRRIQYELQIVLKANLRKILYMA